MYRVIYIHPMGKQISSWINDCHPKNIHLILYIFYHKREIFQVGKYYRATCEWQKPKITCMKSIDGNFLVNHILHILRRNSIPEERQKHRWRQTDIHKYYKPHCYKILWNFQRVFIRKEIWKKWPHLYPLHHLLSEYISITIGTRPPSL